VLRRLTALIFPLTCPGCGRDADPVCADCAAGLHAPPSAPAPPGLDAWAAPFAYAGVARELVARVKYRGAHAVTAWLATEMALVAPLPVPEIVTWAPTTAARRRERGFDHAQLLARHVARGLARPARSLLRRGDDRPQTGLPAADRRVGPRLVARDGVPASVLIVDDVTTTGATLAAAATALRGVGATRVVALTAARTPPPGWIRPR
jgi:predicted amidophosphoribosyltransferase